MQLGQVIMAPEPAGGDYSASPEACCPPSQDPQPLLAEVLSC